MRNFFIKYSLFIALFKTYIRILLILHALLVLHLLHFRAGLIASSLMPSR